MLLYMKSDKMPKCAACNDNWFCTYFKTGFLCTAEQKKDQINLLAFQSSVSPADSGFTLYK